MRQESILCGYKVQRKKHRYLNKTKAIEEFMRRCPLDPAQFLKRALNTFVILLLNLLKTVCLPPSFNGKWNRTHAAPQFAADSLCTVQSAVSIVYRLSTYTYTFLNIVTENPSRDECFLSHHHNIRACLIWVSKYYVRLSSKHSIFCDIVYFPWKCLAQWTLYKNH